MAGKISNLKKDLYDKMLLSENGRIYLVKDGVKQIAESISLKSQNIERITEEAKKNVLGSPNGNLTWALSLNNFSYNTNSKEKYYFDKISIK